VSEKKLDEMIKSLDNINFLLGNYIKRIHEIEVILELVLEELKVKEARVKEVLG